MKCPYCDKEMIAGYIQSSGHIYWSENIRKVAGIPPRKNGMCISDNTGMGSGHMAKAVFCKECRKIIMDI